MSSFPTTCHLVWRIPEWPAIDQELWAAGLAPRDQFDDPAYAAALSHLTIRNAARGHGRYLGVLAAKGLLDPAVPPAARVMPAHVRVYLAALQAAGNTNNSIVTRFFDLQAALRVMHPEADFSWLTSPGGTSLRSLLPATPKRIEPMDSAVLLAWGHELMDDALRRGHPAIRCTRYRNGLLIALLAALAPRLRSTAALRLERHVIAHGTGYQLIFTAEDVKNRRRIEYPVPPELVSRIDMTPISILSYQGRPIRLRGTMLNLTDMWRAAGCPEYRRPVHWLVLEETARFRAHAQAHWTEPDGPGGQNIIQDDITRLDPDGFVATARGRHGGTWAHWQLALAYARYLSPEFHLWCNTVVRAALVWHGGRSAADHDPLWQHLALQFRALHGRLDTLERHAADLMFLQLSAQELVLGNRLEFTGLGRSIIAKVVAAEPFGGQCPCCLRERVLTEAGRPVSGAEFDHFFHRSLNRPEHGWLICAECHAELSHGGYLVRFTRVPEFRAFQAEVLEHRRRERTAPDTPTR